MGYAKVCNHPQWLKTTYNHPQLPKKLTTTTQKKSQHLSQTVMLLDFKC